MSSFTAAALFCVVLFQVFLGLSSVVFPAFVPLASLLIAALFATLCLKLRWGLYLLVLCVPLDIGHISIMSLNAPESLLKGNTSFHWCTILTVVVLAAWFTRAAAGAGISRRATGPAPAGSAGLDPILLLLFLLALWGGISVLWSPNRVVGTVQFAKLLVNMGIFLVVYSFIDSAVVLRRACWCLLAIGVVLSIVSLYTLWGIDFKVDFKEVYWAGRADALLYSYMWKLFGKVYWLSSFGVLRNRGTAFMHSAELSMTMNFLIAIGTGMLLSTPRQKRLERAILWVMLVMLVSSHITTLSRAGTVSLFVMIAFFLVVFNKSRERLLRHTLQVALSIGTLFVLVQQEHLIDIAYKRLSNSSAGTVSWEQRVKWWTTCWHHFLPTSGRGSGIGANYFYVRPGPHLHNIYFSFLFDLGVVGLGLLVIVILMVLKDTLPTIKYQETFPQYMQVAACGGFLAILAQGTLDLHYNIVKLWLFLAIGLATIKLVKEELQEQRARQASSEAGRDVAR